MRLVLFSHVALSH